MRDKLTRFYTWEDYGIRKERLKYLRECCKQAEYKPLVIEAAYLANPYIADWIVKSVCWGKTYEGIEFDRDLGRIPCGRTDFYGYRRLFYSIFDVRLRINGTTSKNDKDTMEKE